MRSRLVMVALPGLLLGCKPEAPPEPPKISCDGVCGHGTKCVEDTCVIDWSAGVCLDPSETICEEPEANPWDECPVDASTMPPFRKISTKKIPKVNTKASRTQTFTGGTERHGEHELEEMYDTVEPRIYDCVSVAACYTDEPMEGMIEFTFRLLPSGKVKAVSASATGPLKTWGVASCVRKAIYEFEFEPFDGEAMTASFQVPIGGSDP